MHQRMRRDYFTLQVRAVDWIEGEGEPRVPHLVIRYEGPPAPFIDGITRDDEPIPADEVDIAFRLQSPLEDPDATGVLSLTDRYTGEFILEVNATVDTMVRFIRAARRFGEMESVSGGRYCVDIEVDSGESFEFEKRTLLVYHADGTLLTRHSLIPSGVEL